MDYEAIVKKVKSELTDKRFRHSMGVCETAVKLALQYGGNIEKIKLAAILHDCAKEIPRNNLLSTAQSFGIVLNDIECREPILAHAKLGAKVAQLHYGIEDPEIIRAIELHTTGAADMSLLDKMIYLADAIEPGRDYNGVEELRSLAAENLDEAILATYDHVIRYLLNERGLLHPATIEGRNALLIQMRS